jgi:hypothetical protein
MEKLFYSYSQLQAAAPSLHPDEFPELEKRSCSAKDEISQLLSPALFLFSRLENAVLKIKNGLGRSSPKR